MKALLGREIENMFFSPQEALWVYSLLGIGGVLSIWVMGPEGLGAVSIESSYTLLAVIGLVLAFGRATTSIERDETNRQLTFLQTLPIPKTHMVHAKFASFFLLSVFTMSWIAIVFGLNMLMNGGKAEYWLIGVVFSSMYLFIIAMSLLWYYVLGANRLNMLFYGLLALWVGIFFAMGLIVGVNTGVSFAQVIGLALVVTVVVYFLCWVLAVGRVRRKGLPQERIKAEDPNE